MNKKGFTLIELLVVILIIGILAAVAIPKLMSAIDLAKGSAARAGISALISSNNMYTIQTGRRQYIISGGSGYQDISGSNGLTILENLDLIGALPIGPYDGMNYKYWSDGDDYSFQVIIGGRADRDKYTLYYYTTTGLFHEDPKLDVRLTL